MLTLRKAPKSRFRPYSKRPFLRLVDLDELHCVMTWGDSFRPAYHSLHVLRNRIQRNIPWFGAIAIAPNSPNERSMDGSWMAIQKSEYLSRQMQLAWEWTFLMSRSSNFVARAARLWAPDTNISTMVSVELQWQLTV